MNKIIFDRLADLYAAGTATETTIRNAVVRGLITAEQYTEITGAPYVA